jgi:Caspase domain
MTFSNSRGVVARRTLLAGAGILLAPSAVLAQGKSNGVALVIGNSKYHWEAQLPNVRRDAPDMARSFQALGLKTELIQDAGRCGPRR